MRSPRYRFPGLPGGWFSGVSWVGVLNMLLLQWFGLRLWMRAETESKQVIEVALLWPVVPLTGWADEYRPSKPKRIRIWSDARFRHLPA